MRTTVRLAFVAALSLTIGAMVTGCADDGQDQQGETRAPEEREEILAEVDSVMIELGGEAAAQLNRGQRWRMISSVGSGLPPPMFKADDLPEPESRGAQLTEAYCVQCHWIPAPQMHSAAEWPVLLRRMELRARTLHDRMGGPMTRDLMGEILMSGMASAVLPSAEDADSLLAYFQRNAMPAVDPATLGEGTGAGFYVEQCSMCHETPDPAAHTAEEWEEVVGRMRANMAVMNVEPMSDEDVRRVLAFLEERVGERPVGEGPESTDEEAGADPEGEVSE